MNLHRTVSKASRRNRIDAAQEAAALKGEFRRADEELFRQGRGAEVVADRKRLLGGNADSTAEVLTVNGVRIKA